MPHDQQATASTRKVFRQSSANLTGWAFIALMGLTALLYIIHEPARWYQPIALCGAVSLVVWVVLVRPSVVVSKDGVELHNLVRDIDMPWDDVDLVTRRWNLKVYTQAGSKYGSWAISQQRPRRQAHAFGDANIGMGFRRSMRQPPEVDTRLTDRKTSAEAVGALIDQTKDEYDQLVATGDLTAAGRKTSVSPARDALLALSGAIILGVLCVIFFT